METKTWGGIFGLKDSENGGQGEGWRAGVGNGLGVLQMPVGHRSGRVKSGAHERTALQRETWCPWHRDGFRVHRQNKVTIGGGGGADEIGERSRPKLGGLQHEEARALRKAR